MATRQNSTNGKPKSPRIQVVLPELICEQLTILANSESRTVSNMAKVLIQEGIKKYFEKKGESSLGTGNAFPSGALPVLTVIKPPACVMLSNAERSTTRSLRDLNLRKNYLVNVLAAGPAEKLTVNPPAKYILERGNILVVMGKTVDLQKLPQN